MFIYIPYAPRIYHVHMRILKYLKAFLYTIILKSPNECSSSSASLLMAMLQWLAKCSVKYSSF